jgi:RsiW-degrading membrane proteinase PrsW (M82 family)
MPPPGMNYPVAPPQSFGVSPQQPFSASPQPQFGAPQFAAAQYVQPAQVAAPPLYVTCLSGPDAGKFYTVVATEAIMGRSTGIGQTDPAVAPQHVAVSAVNHRLRFRALTPNPVFINAQPFSSGELMPGQEFRLGASIWKVNVAPGQQGANIFQSMQEQLNRLAGTEKLEGFSLREMFSEVFKKRTAEELEDYLTVGTYRTTPPIDKAQTGWPKPWLFLRVLVAVIVAYFGFTIIMTNFHNTKAVPAVILMGSLAVPLATVLLFFELNTPRNVSFYKIVMLIAMGGVLSLLVAIIGYDLPVLGQLGPLSPGIIEEVAKLATVVVVVRQATRYKYILNGMLFGAAVGVGFAVFESAGYAFEHIQYTVNGTQLQMAFDQMSFVIYLRALLSPFGHVAWTAIAAAALWRVKKDQPLKISMFVDPKFLKAFIIPVILHTLWDTPIPGGLAVGVIKWSTLGVISWYVVFAMVQQGLRQVKADQVHATKLTLQSMQAVA